MSSWVSQNSVFLSLPEQELLALLAYGEAASDGVEGMMAVLNTVRNRATQPSAYADSSIPADVYVQVALKQKQYSSFNLNDSVRATLLKFAGNWDAYYASNPTLQSAYDLAGMLLNGTLADNTGGATHFFAPAGVSQTPSWAASMDYIGQIGTQLFYSVLPAWQRVQSDIAGVSASVSEELGIDTTTTYIIAGIIGIAAIMLIGRKRG